jgi:hypothetical protein
MKKIISQAKHIDQQNQKKEIDHKGHIKGTHVDQKFRESTTRQVFCKTTNGICEDHKQKDSQKDVAISAHPGCSGPAPFEDVKIDQRVDKKDGGQKKYESRILHGPHPGTTLRFLFLAGFNKYQALLVLNRSHPCPKGFHDLFQDLVSIGTKNLLKALWTRTIRVLISAETRLNTVIYLSPVEISGNGW